MLQKEMESGYSIVQPLVIADPYELSPLSAVIAFDTQAETAVSVVVKGKDRNADIAHSFEEFSTRHLIPVYGLYADTENTVQVTAVDQNGNAQVRDILIKTEALLYGNANSNTYKAERKDIYLSAKELAVK